MKTNRNAIMQSFRPRHTPAIRPQDMVLALHISAPFAPRIVLVVQLDVLVPVLLGRLGRRRLRSRELGRLLCAACPPGRKGLFAAESALSDEAAHDVGEVVGEQGPDGGDAGQRDGRAELGNRPRGDVGDVPGRVLGLVEAVEVREANDARDQCAAWCQCGLDQVVTGETRARLTRHRRSTPARVRTSSAWTGSGL